MNADVVKAPPAPLWAASSGAGPLSACAGSLASDHPGVLLRNGGMASNTLRDGRRQRRTMRGPALASLSLRSPDVRSTSSHPRFSISPLRHPVRTSSRIAARAGGHIPPSASACLSARPRRRYSSGVRNRSRLPASCSGAPRGRGSARAGPVPRPRQGCTSATADGPPALARVGVSLKAGDEVRSDLRPADFFQSHTAQGGQDVPLQHRAVRRGGGQA